MVRRPEIQRHSFEMAESKERGGVFDLEYAAAYEVPLRVRR